MDDVMGYKSPLDIRMDSSKFEAFLGWQFRSVRSMLGASERQRVSE